MNRKIAVTGLGYVGLPVAVAFGMKSHILAFDIDKTRIEELIKNYDKTGEVTNEELKETSISFTADAEKLKEADFHIVAVPTPIDKAKRPDLTPLIKAAELVGAQLRKNAIIVFESTVYPGTTEEVCAPVLEKKSGLICGKDFFLGYSPERINPGDKEHSFRDIVKVVAGQTPEITEIIAEVYRSVVDAGVYPVSSIKVAEAAKVIENTQRDLNIALVNELALIFEKLNIDTQEVLEAAGTKWNFLPFRPGLVGGHCIGVDPYYLTYKAEQVGHHAKVILSGREINDTMPLFIVKKLIKEMVNQNFAIKGACVSVFGITFKENVPDIRNTKVVDIIHELSDYGVEVQVCDPIADANEVKKNYGITLTPIQALKPAEAVVFAVPHKELLQKDWNTFFTLLLKERGIVFDIKSVISKGSLNKKTRHIRL